MKNGYFEGPYTIDISPCVDVGAQKVFYFHNGQNESPLLVKEHSLLSHHLNTTGRTFNYSYNKFKEKLSQKLMIRCVPFLSKVNLCLCQAKWSNVRG